MATIEEIAKDLYQWDLHCDDEEWFPITMKNLCKQEIESYTMGAKAQREIDIEKSKMCFCKVCGSKECSKRNVTCIEYKEFVRLLLEE